ncbi:WG containing repeat-containing protein [Reichenbachiella agariperforans]|uniref:WG containing repeat-containing protein n=1 Tax=Reichenbachiella agariperforans TaxID=156994 RepID=A0A1M6TRJ0_REIAG|nr:WG repeat-containing protein [Reichenbachiella agariperforans]SHK59544.1 WG containing repeat-containing protein [Reichenbachiella agariperforans]
MRKLIRSGSATTLLLCFLLTYTLPSFAQGNYSYFEENERVGLKDKNGETLITPKYQKLGWSSGFQYPVKGVIGYYDGTAWGLVTVKGKVVTTPKYYSLEAVHGSLIVASIKGKFSNLLLYGTINANGQTIISFKNQTIKLDHDHIIVSEKIKHKRYSGLYTQTNKEILPKSYRTIQYLDHGMFQFTDTLNQHGLVRTTGEIILTPSLDSIAPYSGDYALVYKTGKVGLISAQGQYIHQPKYKAITSDQTTIPFDQFDIKTSEDQLNGSWSADSIFMIRDRFLAICTNGWAEIINQNKETVYRGLLPTKIDAFKSHLVITNYKTTTLIPSGKTVFRTVNFDSVKIDKHYLYGYTDKHWKVYNSFGRELNGKSYDGIQTESNNLIPVKRNGYWGYLDLSGEVAINYKYEAVSPFFQEIAAVNYLGYNNVINQFGEVVGEASYDSIWINHDNTARVKQRSRTDILNKNGAALFQTYNQLTPHQLGYLEKTESGQVGLIDHNGRILFYPKYDMISPLIRDRFIIIQKRNQIAVSFKDGSFLIPFTDDYQAISDISEGFLSIQKDNQYGFIDFDQQLRIANRYDSVGHFQEGLCPVRLHGHWGYVDKKEELIIQPNLDSVSHFVDHMAIVKRDEKYGAYGIDGEIAIDINYDQITKTPRDMFIVASNQKYGLYDSHGNKILSPSYDLISESSDGYFIVSRRTKAGLMNTNGLYTIPLKYDEIYELKYGQYVCKKIVK